MLLAAVSICLRRRQICLDFAFPGFPHDWRSKFESLVVISHSKPPQLLSDAVRRHVNRAGRVGAERATADGWLEISDLFRFPMPYVAVRDRPPLTHRPSCSTDALCACLSTQVFQRGPRRPRRPLAAVSLGNQISLLPQVPYFFPSRPSFHHALPLKRQRTVAAQTTKLSRPLTA